MKEVSRAIITDEEGKVLLGKRGRGVAEGSYALIGGKPNQGETAEEAIVREVREEIGLEFDPIFYLEEVDSDSDPKDPWKVSYFIGLVAGELRLDQTEVEEIVYVAEDDLDGMYIGFNHKRILADFLKKR